MSHLQMHHYEQECIPVGCVPPACYCTGGSLFRGVSGQRTLCWTGTLWIETPPWTESPPPDRDLLDRDLPWTETSPVNRITDRCKNINLLQLRCGR